MKKFFKRFRRDKSGAALAEYALIAGLVSAVAIVGLQTVGYNTAYAWWKTADRLFFACGQANGASCTPPGPAPTAPGP